MAVMSDYCCAYPAARLRAYAAWSEKVPPLVAVPDDQAEAGAPAADEGTGREPIEYYYLHDNYVVTAGVWVDEQVAFDDVTDEWKRFCTERLEFVAPAAEPEAAGGAEAS